MADSNFSLSLDGLPSNLFPAAGQPLSPLSMYGGMSTSVNQSQGENQSSSYIPNYSETPILENLANYSASMAPQVYQWGMQQYANNQGNIDSLMRNALSYASPQRQAVDMGQAEAGVQQASEAARQSSIADLQSYGIDPSAGRYAALDQASRVQSGAAAAGAGNQQRMADVATGNAMQNQAISSSLQNVAQGVASTNAADQFANTGMSLKYSPLGTESTGSTESSGMSFGTNSGTGSSTANKFNMSSLASGAPMHGMMAAGGPVGYQPGGYVPTDVSPSRGAQVDDVNANLNVGEFVVPRDVTQWLGQAHFYKLMAQARKARAMAASGGMKVGYGAN